MKKIFKFFKIARDIFSQIEGNFLIKIKFIKSFFLHYFLKMFGMEYINFPELKIRVNNALFSTRKNTIDFWMCWKDYEKETFNQLKKEIKPNDTFIDVGANIGRFTIIMAEEGLCVYSFEPIKDNFELLRTNIKNNNLEKKTQLYNVGLGDKKEKKDICYIPYKHGEASVVFNFKKGIKEIININKLDDVKIKVQNNCFLKIDVEGFEYNVLIGAGKFIKKYKPKIIIEIWREETKEILKNYGYIQRGEIWYPK